MRDIYVATIIDTHNYGTVVQAVATANILTRYGNPIYIDYCRKNWTTLGFVHTYLYDKKHNFFVNVVRLALQVPNRMKSSHVFRGFVTEHLNLCSAEYYVHGGENRERFPQNAVYCVGSDQTWNIECNDGIDPVYFLVNVPSDRYKIAFCASFGRELLETTEAKETKRILQGFDAISVRESSSFDILCGMGIQSVVLKDPVLLCDPTLWYRLAEGVPVSNEGYVFVYALNKNPDMLAFANQLAQRKRLKVKIVGFDWKKGVPDGWQKVYLPLPAQWLALFRDATYVVTDSLHGACFSIFFKKEMFVYDPPRYSMRLKDVLRDFGLEDRRVIGAKNLIDIDARRINWTEVEEKLKKFRRKADEFLDEVFKGVIG